MASTVACANGVVSVRLSGLDRLLTGRRVLDIDLTTVRTARMEHRRGLEATIDHRVVGFGTHDGSARPGRRRVGTMLGRAVPGPQFWAVSGGSSTDRLLVLDLATGPFARVVLDVDPDAEHHILASVTG